MSPSNVQEPLSLLSTAYRSATQRYLPEESPFSTVHVDVTHRCNMECANCFIPIRTLPDFPAEQLFAMLRRFRRRVRLRLVGAEPTVREDLPELIRGVRACGHTPVILTNGLKLGRRSYVATLKQAGLRTVYLSTNGGLRDDMYEILDGVPCASRKLKALDNLASERMNVTIGLIVARGVNDPHVPEYLQFLLKRAEVAEIHLRSVGAIGRHMNGEPFNLDELEGLLRSSLGSQAAGLEQTAAIGSSRDFALGKLRFQLTQWPDLGSRARGRLTPDGFVEPMFESMVANAGGY